MKCRCCPGQGEPLGALGRLRWYRCRDCGAVFHNTPRKRRPKPEPRAQEARP